ncbi:TOM1-like protein 3 [Tasmannia lanceolata]|uniref:TOM1-like protein 3 n=1 Tax=Tasmannia lanceolata TaxID=3420 RepID=UPI0040634AEC
MANAAMCVERATSDMLISPDWAINIEICDIINMDPGQAKDAMKTLKKRLGSKNPQIQLLALFVLETLSKNCGDPVHLQIIERDILHEMVKIVKKKPNLNVREKILILLDTWQDAFGGPGGKYPQYYAAYHELKSAGVDFPPRTENAAPLFTPPQTHALVPHPDPSLYDGASVEASLQSDASALSLAEIQNARGIVDVLTEMLSAFYPRNSKEDLKQEVFVDLVDQCHTHQKRVMLLVNNTGDEELLHQGLILNDDLQRVVCQYDNMLKGTSTIGVVGATEKSDAPLVNVNHEDDESDDDFSQLAHRSSRDNVQGQGRKPTSTKNEQVYSTPFLPPPPSSKKTNADSVTYDYLSGDDIYRSEGPLELLNPTSIAVPLHTNSHVSPPSTPKLTLSSPPRVIDSISSPGFTKLPNHIEPSQTAKSFEERPLAPWEVQPSGFLPPPPSKYNQRQQFFEQQNQSLSSGTSPASGSGSSYDGLVGRTQNLSLDPSDLRDSSPSTKQTKPEDNLFKDLVDFAKAKSSPSSKLGSQRTR